MEINDALLDQLIDKLVEDALRMAEDMFGPRNEAFSKYSGVLFWDEFPCLSYPDVNRKEVKILLNNRCKVYAQELLLQLSHEVCHLLYPTGQAITNVLEEGISTYFSIIYYSKYYPNCDYAHKAVESHEKYQNAYKLVEELISNNPDAIKKIREKKSFIAFVTYQDLNELQFNISDEDLHRLTERF